MRKLRMERDMTYSTNAKLRELRERVAAGKLVKMPFDALGGA